MDPPRPRSDRRSFVGDTFLCAAAALTWSYVAFVFLELQIVALSKEIARITSNDGTLATQDRVLTTTSHCLNSRLEIN